MTAGAASSAKTGTIRFCSLVVLGRRYALGLFVALSALAVLPLGAQGRTGSGQRFGVSGRSMWLDCRGDGSPMVLLEAGQNESADTWDPVFLTVASFTRVCRYDRAGLGRSGAPASAEPRTGRDVVADLHGLLSAANERGAMVLVGHSLGGAFIRLYAAAYPGRTAALVLVDAVHEREFAGIDALLTSAQREAGAGMRPMSPEGLDIEAINAELRRTTTRLRIPVLVVARGRPLADDEMPPTWSAEQRRRREQLRVDLQADLARLSRAGELVVATRSGHFVHHEEPSLVVEAIRKVVTAWRAARNPS